MQQAKAHTETVEDTGEGLLMRSKLDDLSVWQSVRRFKRVGCIAMLAAFSASLDGYQINLNGGIVSNAGFIRQFSTSGTTIIAGKYISAWGGIQSAGQTIGQVLLQYATERLGRKAAMMIIWVVLTASVFAESFATHWQHWLVAKLFSGMGVGMLQSTMPLYLSEISPTQLRGFFINAYSFWFVLGQLFASVALNRLKANDPLDFRTPIYTQWAMIGCILVAFLLIPESPWWLASKGKIEQNIDQQIVRVPHPIILTNADTGIFFACLATFSTTGASAIGYAYAAEIPQQRLRAQTAGWSLAVSNCIAIIFSFCTPLMINGSVKWGVKTGFFFAGTGTVAVAIAWFILPEVARRTPAEIDELFEKKVNLRKFDKYVTEVQVHAHELQDRKKVVDEV
ncbi:Putative glucose transporter HXT5 [Fusarium oxysporum f. sp. cubense race 1]|uniref:Putative glucose transporter HXT5 n=1 Tax=Fusarium oxysporum f. sp. cubense (strain race 1) TaxID=1229664 RepID=N4TU55_FUSC1|nr:Putative glucose transporter HXT5 [Fusarium oxysporum f. sp. cubense race 1]